MANLEEKSWTLPLQGVIGFNGHVAGGLLLHPDDEHLISPLGSTVVLKHLLKNNQHFLQKNGHDAPVSCVALSSSGRYLASGQETVMAFPAYVVVWDLETCEPLFKLNLHKGKVQSLAFSPDETYLATLGGRDDNKLIVWDLKTGDAICGATAANDTALFVKYLNNRNDQLVTGGNYNLRLWDFDRTNRKLRPNDFNMGNLKRIVQCCAIDTKDEYMYLGTTTGDVMKVSVVNRIFKAVGPVKKSFSLGIHALTLTKDGHVLVGSGDGDIALLDKETLNIVRKLKLNGTVTSLQLNAARDHFFVGTKQCSIFLVELATFEHELRATCHSSRINDVAFAYAYSELFATCGGSDIRVWNASTCNELLRIQVPNLECLSVAFAQDGKSILSGWNDGKIRAFTPQTGKLIYTIHDAHNGGVSALQGTKDSHSIISGGVDGQVRVWAITPATQKMLASMKEHKGAVNSIRLNIDDTECISASSDGSCIVWSLERFVRNNCLFAATQFKAALYHPDQSQLLTSGTDRKITYWDAVDGSPIRIMDGSATAELTALDIAADGERFVSGGADKVVKLYSYDEGKCYFRGVGHSGTITKVHISPDQKFMVSTGDEGAVFVWKMLPLDNSPASGGSPVAATVKHSTDAQEQEQLLHSIKSASISALKL